MKPHYDYREEPTDNVCQNCGNTNINDEGQCPDCNGDEAMSYFNHQHYKRKQEASLDEMEKTIAECKQISGDIDTMIMDCKIKSNIINKLKT